MNATRSEPCRPALALYAATAADLMTPDPVSVSERAGVREALALLTERGFSAAPVIDLAGHPVGVLSRTDLLVHQGETVWHAPEREPLPHGMSVEVVDPARVRDVMTPVVFSVPPEMPAGMVVRRLLALKVHRLFVVDEDGVLVGVISAADVLRHLET
jgi:CBS-domain-containing membrane protein